MGIVIPSVLNPWFVVVRNEEIGAGSVHHRYYTIPDNSYEVWTTDPHNAMLFTNLVSATRIAEAAGEGINIIVLWDKEQLQFYARKVDE
jgi:hypothetical protein